MLYTRRGDDGTTKKFDCDQRFSKSSIIAEALGTLDEINSFLGICKVGAKEAKIVLPSELGLLADAVYTIQNDLFCIQAEVAGADKHTNPERILWLEKIIDTIEKELPPITSFFVSGGVRLAAEFDTARTIARRAERIVIAADEEGKVKVSAESKAYLNRLSSCLYAAARLITHVSGIKEQSPTY